MDILNVDLSNIDSEHICCAISDKKGLVILSSKKKLPFDETDTLPTFKQCCKDSTLEEKGMVLYYSNQCPHTDKYAPLIAEIAHSKGTKLILRKIDSKEAAQSAPAPFTTYSFFDEGKFVTNEIFSESKFMKYLEGKGL